jgi:hypothetical protein
VAHLDSVERELRLLIDHREDLVAERTPIISRLRWHLHELHPGWTPPTKIDRTSAFDTVTAHLDARGDNALVHRLALRLVEHLRMLTTEIDELAAEITERVTIVAPSLLAIVGCGPLTAAKIVGETAHTHGCLGVDEALDVVRSVHAQAARFVSTGSSRLPFGHGGCGSAGAAHVIVHRHELIARSSGQRVEGPPSRVDLRLMRK